MEKIERLKDDGVEGVELVAAAIFDLADAVRFAAKELGKEGAAGPGAIEFLATEVHEGLNEVAGQLADVNGNLLGLRSGK